MTARHGLGLLALFLAPLALGAAEKYTLKIEKPAQPGDRMKQIVRDTSETKMTVLDGDGKAVQDKKESKDTDAVYEETILAKKEGERAEKLSRKYESVKYTKDGEKLDLDLVGKVLIIERKGKNFSFQYEGGGEVTGDTLAFLKDEFKNKDEDDRKMERALMPKDPVAVGDSWTCDVAEITKSMGKDASESVDTEKAKASGKLLKVYSKDGATFGVIEVAIDLPVTRMGKASDNITADPSSVMSFKVTLDACIDGSRTSGTMSGGMKVDVGAKVKGADGEFTLKVTGKGKISHAQTPAK